MVAGGGAYSTCSFFVFFSSAQHERHLYVPHITIKIRLTTLKWEDHHKRKNIQIATCWPQVSQP